EPSPHGGQRLGVLYSHETSGRDRQGRDASSHGRAHGGASTRSTTIIVYRSSAARRMGLAAVGAELQLQRCNLCACSRTRAEWLGLHHRGSSALLRNSASLNYCLPGRRRVALPIPRTSWQASLPTGSEQQQRICSCSIFSPSTTRPTRPASRLRQQACKFGFFDATPVSRSSGAHPGGQRLLPFSK
ncbi:unnamed protein product, partial [Urochloa humidicola]